MTQIKSDVTDEVGCHRCFHGAKERKIQTPRKGRIPKKGGENPKQGNKVTKDHELCSLSSCNGERTEVRAQRAPPVSSTERIDPAGVAPFIAGAPIQGASLRASVIRGCSLRSYPRLLKGDGFTVLGREIETLFCVICYVITLFFGNDDKGRHACFGKWSWTIIRRGEERGTSLLIQIL